MIEEEAVVISAAAGRATVRVERREACAACVARKTCHPAPGASFEMPVADPLGVRPGDRVSVGIPDSALLAASAAAYLLPASLLVAGASVGWAWAGTDGASLAGAVVGLVAGLALLPFLSRRTGAGEPSITRVIEREQPA